MPRSTFRASQSGSKDSPKTAPDTAPFPDHVLGPEISFPLDRYVEALVDRFRAWVAECIASSNLLDKVVELSNIVQLLRHFQRHQTPMTGAVSESAPFTEIQLLDAITNEFRKLIQAALLDFFQTHPDVFERLGFMAQIVTIINPVILNAKLTLYKVVMKPRKNDRPEEVPELPFSLLPFPEENMKAEPEKAENLEIAILEHAKLRGEFESWLRTLKVSPAIQQALRRLAQFPLRTPKRFIELEQPGEKPFKLLSSLLSRKQVRETLENSHPFYVRYTKMERQKGGPSNPPLQISLDRVRDVDSVRNI